MANDLLNPPETETTSATNDYRGLEERGGATTPNNEGRELDALMGKAFQEKPIWEELYDNVHDLFFPSRLPPLELTSTPIPVPDPMAVKRSPVSIAISVAVNVGILALLLFAFRNNLPPQVKKAFNIADVDIKAYVPTGHKIPAGGGGGGGAHEIPPPIKGRLPKIEKVPILQPQVPVLDKPKIAIEPAINVQVKLPDNPTLPTIGVMASKNVVLASNGSGSGGGMGSGTSGGLGSGDGNGVGPGKGGNFGGGLYHVGDGVSDPKLTFQPEAEFSDEARRAKYEGTVTVSLIVDAQGNPQNVHIAHALGMGLDEKALEAVRQYKFKPAIEKATGKAVPVPISVAVTFRLY